jgi:ribosomal protein S18 acetylase RimI-like enzyme
MEIRSSTPGDLDEIFRLYQIAIEYQIEKGAVPWSGLSKGLVAKEIEEGRQWKLVIDGSIACVWMITFSDPQIWEDRDKDPSLYIHRVATDIPFRGRKLVSQIVLWSKEYAQLNQKKFIRLDTAGENAGLVRYYQNCGFTFLGARHLKDSSGLPQHYAGVPICLFQMPVE